MTCLYKEYEVKIKMVQELLLQLKMGYNMKTVILWGINLCWQGEIQILWRGESTGRFFQVWGMSKFLVSGQTPDISPVGKTLYSDIFLLCMCKAYYKPVYTYLRVPEYVHELSFHKLFAQTGYTFFVC